MNLSDSPSLSPVLPGHRRSFSESDPLVFSQKLLGRYRIVGRLGEGGMGIVYEAEDTQLKRIVAVKLLPQEVSTNPEALQRFLREAQAAAKLNHPNVVAVYDIGEAEGTRFIVMELIRGGSANDFLRAHGPFHWMEATSISIDVCRGMAAAHRAGLIHRDIKPANLLRSSEGIVKLGDFGLVKPIGRKGTTATGLADGVVGTPHFMSPEQCRNAPVDERSDIYSLGATYYALLTASPPFPFADPAQVLFAHCSSPVPDPRELVADIPPRCVAIIHRAMSKHRTQRYTSAANFLADLEELSAASAESTSPRLPPPTTFAWSKATPSETADGLSLAASYPGEKTEIAPRPSSWKKVAFALPGLLVLIAILIALALRHETAPRPADETADWAAQSVAAEQAIRSRQVAAMKKQAERIELWQKRETEADPFQRESMNQLLVRLDKAIAFRESITEKGLVLGLDGLVTSVVFSPDDRWFAVGQWHGNAGAFVWDSHTGERRHTVWPLRDKTPVKVRSLSFAPDSNVLAAGCDDGMDVKLWHRSDNTNVSLPIGTGVIRTSSVAFSPVARNVVAGFEPTAPGRGRNYLKIWNIDTRNAPFAFKAEHVDQIASVAFCTGGEQVATGSHDKRVVLWNAETGRIWRELRTGLVIQAIACAPQGRVLAVAGTSDQGSMLQFWDYAGERLIATHPSPHGPCRCIAFSRDGTLMATGSGRDVLLWNPETQQLLTTLKGHGQEVTSLAFSGVGGILATGSNDQTVRLWDVVRYFAPPDGP